jgi:hypothetical protein
MCRIPKTVLDLVKLGQTRAGAGLAMLTGLSSLVAIDGDGAVEVLDLLVPGLVEVAVDETHLA